LIELEIGLVDDAEEPFGLVELMRRWRKSSEPLAGKYAEAKIA
jgi:hypothetical protein